jgi:hypothetical protein
MSTVMLTLGPVTFENFEIPSCVAFGGGQRLAIHRLAGGGRIIDTLGRDDEDIRFEGIFSGADATLRARTLDELRASGQVSPLTWDVFFYRVIVRQFEAYYQNSYWIPYRLACTVLRDEASLPVKAVMSLATDVIADVASAAGFSGVTGLDFDDLQAAVATTNACVRGSADFVTAQSAFGAAQATTATTLGSAEGQLGSVLLQGPMSAGTGVAQLATAVGAAQQLAAVAAANGYLGRAAVNLANAST